MARIMAQQVLNITMAASERKKAAPQDRSCMRSGRSSHFEFRKIKGVRMTGQATVRAFRPIKSASAVRPVISTGTLRGGDPCITLCTSMRDRLEYRRIAVMAAKYSCTAA
jgi:hypothetical protein